MSRPDYVVYGIMSLSVAMDLTKRGYNVKLITDASIEIDGNKVIDYELLGIQLITTESLFSSEIA